MKYSQPHASAKHLLKICQYLESKTT